VTTGKRRFRREDEIVLAVLADLESEACDAPLTTGTLERLATGTLDKARMNQARHHIAACLSCLNAYARVQSVLEAPSPGETIEEGSPTASGAARGAGTRAARLEDEVRRLREKIENELRRFKHRTVQRQYSEPPAWDDERSDSSDEDSTTSPGARARRLAAARRALEERLAVVTTLETLVRDYDRLLAAARTATPEATSTRRLREELENAGRLLESGLDQLTGRVRI